MTNFNVIGMLCVWRFFFFIWFAVVGLVVIGRPEYNLNYFVCWNFFRLPCLVRSLTLFFSYVILLLFGHATVHCYAVIESCSIFSVPVQISISIRFCCASILSLFANTLFNRSIICYSFLCFDIIIWGIFSFMFEFHYFIAWFSRNNEKYFSVVLWFVLRFFVWDDCFVRSCSLNFTSYFFAFIFCGEAMVERFIFVFLSVSWLGILVFWLFGYLETCPMYRKIIAFIQFDCLYLFFFFYLSECDDIPYIFYTHNNFSNKLLLNSSIDYTFWHSINVC